VSAIKPHLERQNDPSETAAEKRFNNGATYEERIEKSIEVTSFGSLGGFGEAYDANDAMYQKLQKSQAELLRLSYTRKALIERLKKTGFSLVTKGRQAFIRLDEPVGVEPVFNPVGDGTIQNTRLLSWTMKMGCPSFSLPAGARETGGSCPGAMAGQSAVPKRARMDAQKFVLNVIDPGGRENKDVELAMTVCNSCYATGGNYAYGSSQYHQVMRRIWTDAALKDRSFVKTMSWAIENADYLLEGGEVVVESKKVFYEREVRPNRFFRIHDSGDFYSSTYLKAWKDIANNFRGDPQVKNDPSRIYFWAPSRMWATPGGLEWVRKINGTDPYPETNNLIIRPSAYHINEQPPPALQEPGSGWANWTVVYAAEIKDTIPFPQYNRPGGSGKARGGNPFDWDCQAYAVDNEAHSCRNARSPNKTGLGEHGDTGCRMCWVRPDKTVNYTEH
jgi:hypothetical protein